MIYEYAIEPELAVEWCKNRSDFYYFYEQFGLGTSRMMAEFPKSKNWKKQFLNAVGVKEGTFDIGRIEELYKKLTECRVLRDGFDYDGNLSWLENTEKENNRKNFQAILSRNNPRNNKKVLDSQFFHTNPLWHLEKEEFYPRHASAMAQSVTVMLSNCSEVHFIDPYFDPDRTKWIRPLVAFLEIISENRACRPAIKKITIHTSSNAEKPLFKQTCETKLIKQIPAGLILTIQRWKQRDGGEKLHARYILTDIGGVTIEPGLDEGKKGETFKVAVIGRTGYDRHWRDYVINPAFDLSEEPFEIEGKRRIE